MNYQTSEGNIFQEKPSLIVDQLAKPKVNLPLDVTTELRQYTKFYITKGPDFFRVECCCEDLLPEYNIYGEMPDGDKKLLFILNVAKDAVFILVVVAIYSQI